MAAPIATADAHEASFLLVSTSLRMLGSMLNNVILRRVGKCKCAPATQAHNIRSYQSRTIRTLRRHSECANLLNGAVAMRQHICLGSSPNAAKI